MKAPNGNRRLETRILASRIVKNHPGFDLDLGVVGVVHHGEVFDPFVADTHKLEIGNRTLFGSISKRHFASKKF